MRTYDLGYLGGGQLARMSMQAAQRMGLRCISLDPGIDTPASQIADAQVGSLSDPAAVAAIFDSCERVTLENEFIPADVISAALSASQRDASALVPGVETLAIIQDKLRQREAYARAGVPSPRAVAVEGEGEAAIGEIGWPMVLKARFGGYDGKGTRYARTYEEFVSHRDLWAGGGWLAEAFVPFRRELAVMVYRSAAQVGAFPTVETIQTNHVCDLVFLAFADASSVAIQAVEAVGGFGLFGVELFELEDGSILVNEMAPRPHNSGHFTMDGMNLSQFEAHVRLCVGLTVPEPVSLAPVVMANLLGQEGARDYRAGLAGLPPEARLHWYGKTEATAGRKMGHLNVFSTDLNEVRNIRDAFYRAWTS